MNKRNSDGASAVHFAAADGSISRLEILVGAVVVVVVVVVAVIVVIIVVVVVLSFVIIM